MENFKVSFSFDQNTIEDIFINSLEGGSNQWLLLKPQEFENSLVGKGHELSFAERLARTIIGNKTLEINVYHAESEAFLGVICYKSFSKALRTIAKKHPYILARILNNNADITDADFIMQYTVVGNISF
jgi:hypothetical protein